MSTVLMYHGIYRDEQDLAERIDPEDRPYAVSEEMFELQLKELQGYRCGLLQETDGASDDAVPQVIITFDDGHASNFDIALPLLLKYNLKAYFFITTGYIENRSHFCTWENLREMQSAGMIIGSHGESHAFFADMEESEALHEFLQSKEKLDRELGESVFSISFPGGRYSLSNVKQAKEAGYLQIFGSGFGIVQSTTRQQKEAINRIPLRNSTTLGRFVQIISCDDRFYATENTKQFLKTSLKKIIGNERYHALYKFAADRR